MHDECRRLEKKIEKLECLILPREGISFAGSFWGSGLVNIPRFGCTLCSRLHSFSEHRSLSLDTTLRALGKEAWQSTPKYRATL